MAAWARAMCGTLNYISCASCKMGALTSLVSPEDHTLGFEHPVQIGDVQGFYGFVVCRHLIATKEDTVRGLQVAGGHAFSQDLNRTWGRTRWHAMLQPCLPFSLSMLSISCH